MRRLALTLFAAAALTACGERAEPARSVTVSGADAAVDAFVADQQARHPGLLVERPEGHPGRARAILTLPPGATGDDQVALSAEAMQARLSTRIS